MASVKEVTSTTIHSVSVHVESLDEEGLLIMTVGDGWSSVEDGWGKEVEHQSASSTSL